MMSETPGFCYEGTNNIVIVPTVSFSKNAHKPTIQKKDGRQQDVLVKALSSAKNSSAPRQTDPIHLEAGDSTQSVIKEPDPCKQNTLEQHKTGEIPAIEDVNRKRVGLENVNKTKKVNSWASNYLQSIDHNNMKPIKTNLSSNNTKNDNKDSPTETNYEINKSEVHTSKPKATIIVEGHKDRLDPGYTKSEFNANEECIEQVQKAISIQKTKKLISSDNSSMVDTIYCDDDNSNIVPAYATLYAKGVDESTYYYNRGRDKDILDAIKYKIYNDLAIERNSRMMNMPTHEEMCKDFIKEISMNKTPEMRISNHYKIATSTKRKSDELPISPSPAKKKKSERSSYNVKKGLTQNNGKNICTKPEKQSKKLVKKEKMPLKKESYKNKKDLDKKQKKNKKTDFDCITTKLQDIHTKVNSPQKQKLKLVHSISEELQSSAENHTHIPIRSVASTENCQKHLLKRQCVEENFDLRSKLSRVNERLSKNTNLLRQRDDGHSIAKIPMDELKITVENQHSEKRKSPKRSGVLTYKSKKCKKLKLVINVLCAESDDDSSIDDSSLSETENNHSQNTDLSFLDDFNVDEIVDSLKHSPIKKVENASRDVEPELNLSKILNLLHAKSEANKIKNSEEFSPIANSSHKYGQTKPVSQAEMKGNVVDENTCYGIQNTTHALVKLLAQSKLKIEQQNTVLHEAVFSEKDKAITAIKSNENNVKHAGEALVIDESIICNDQIKQESANYKQCSSSYPNITRIDNGDQLHKHGDNKKNIDVAINAQETLEVDVKEAAIDTREISEIDEKKPSEGKRNKDAIESVIIYEQGVNVIDLTAETEIKMPGRNYITTSSTPYHKQPVKTKHKHDSVSKKSKRTTTMEHNSVVDLTGDTDADIDQRGDIVTESGVTSDTKTNAQTEITSNILTNQTELHLIPLPDSNNHKFKENDEFISTTNCILQEGKSITNQTYIISKGQNEQEDLPSTSQLKLIPLPDLNKNKFKEKNDISETKNLKFKRKSNENEIDAYNDLNKKMITKSGNLLTDLKSDYKLQPEVLPICVSGNAVNGNNVNLNKVRKQILSNAPNVNQVVESDTEVVMIKENATKKVLKINVKHEEDIGPKEKEVTVVKKQGIEAKTKFQSHEETKKNVNRVIKTEPVKKCLNNIAEVVAETNIMSESDNLTKKNNESKNKYVDNSEGNNKIEKETPPEIQKGPENNKIPPTNIVKKDKSEASSNLTGFHKLKVALLEKIMLECLHKETKVIKFIHKGRFSKIFSCKDSSGQTYAAKLLPRKIHVKEKERMLRELQKDIPRENLYTIFMVDAFAVQNQWCFLMEFYPKTLTEALNENAMRPFHIDRVQDLARQLVSAVMLLRNNQIIHSDIRPSHILLNASNDRLKLCGFDRAFYRQNASTVPRIVSTPLYRPPEVVLGFSSGFYSIDVWASAIVIYQMATNKLLFTAHYNNDILYQQMSIFGNLPWDMVEASDFRHQHFRGRIFMRRVGHIGQDAVLIHRFYKTKRLHMSLCAAYTEHWDTRYRYQRNSDIFKLNALHKLLEQMLLLDPRIRLAIEFVCVHPFIYEA